MLAAAAQERQLVHQLAETPSLIRPTLAALPPSLAAAVGSQLRAALALRRLAGPPSGKPVTLHLDPAPPAGQLLADYHLAQSRFGVRWQTLAAVNLVESAFGRVGNTSSAGAQGPMQFLPATWKAYGLGGDIHSPRDAVLGAGNYLHQSGAPADERRALFAYNHSEPVRAGGAGLRARDGARPARIPDAVRLGGEPAGHDLVSRRYRTATRPTTSRHVQRVRFVACTDPA